MNKNRIFSVIAVLVVALLVSSFVMTPVAYAHGRRGHKEKVEIAFCFTHPRTGESRTISFEVPEWKVSFFKRIVEKNPFLTWGPCGGDDYEMPSCPTCGPPVWEEAGDGMAMVWYSRTPCEVCKVGGHNWGYEIVMESMVRAWSSIPFSFEYPAGVLHEAEEVTGADGETYYVLEVDGHTADNALLWGPDGVGDRFRDHGPVTKYNACSVAPGYQDTTADGLAMYLGGHNVSDWATFLVNEGYFEDTQDGWNAALEWADDLREAGELALP